MIASLFGSKMDTVGKEHLIWEPAIWKLFFRSFAIIPTRMSSTYQPELLCHRETKPEPDLNKSG